MGTLVTLSAIKENRNGLSPRWYFSDAYYSRDGSGFYKFNWPSLHYPHVVCIHNDDFKNHTSLCISIREWIEFSLSETVIFDQIDYSYKVYRTQEAKDRRDWDLKWDIDNVWNAFYFANAQSAVAFSLRFSEFTQECTKQHPTQHHGF